MASWPTWPLQAGAGRSPAKKKMLTAHVLNQSINPGERPETKEQLLASSPLRPGGAPAIVPVRTAPDTSSPADLARLWLAGSCGRATALRSHRGVWRMGGGRRRAGGLGGRGPWGLDPSPRFGLHSSISDTQKLAGWLLDFPARDRNRLAGRQTPISIATPRTVLSRDDVRLKYEKI